MIVSREAFTWVVTALAVGICVGWGAYDVYLLCKHLPARGRAAWSDRPAWRDQIFGSIIGLCLVVTGLLGVLKYHLHW